MSSDGRMTATKVMFAVHGEARTEVLLSAALRDILVSVGAVSLQVNIDDPPVEGALRFGPGTAIAAVVSVWTDGDVPAMVDVVAKTVDDPDLHAYRVAERVRLDPAPTPDGVRGEVFAQVAVLRRPESMSREDYLAYWMREHTAIAIRTQNTSAYIQNVVEEALTPSSPVIAAIVEEHFPMTALTDVHEFYGSRGDDAELNRRMSELMMSVAAFGADQGLDLVPTSRYFWSL